MPPCARREDIPVLIDHCRLGSRRRCPLAGGSFGSGRLRVSGNVRELENMVERGDLAGTRSSISTISAVSSDAAAAPSRRPVVPASRRRPSLELEKGSSSRPSRKRGGTNPGGPTPGAHPADPLPRLERLASVSRWRPAPGPPPPVPGATLSPRQAREGGRGARNLKPFLHNIHFGSGRTWHGRCYREANRRASYHDWTSPLLSSSVLTVALATAGVARAVQLDRRGRARIAVMTMRGRWRADPEARGF
jgi:hypothetical protein